ncbi:hypothetical protein A3J20_03895 [Candidatus Gottesmanbacteria bacterium RIFCSPLOWO2_02_FULL_42_29]|uniref:Uncharacterized protein n=2 Tax=Candidatus Gottesmaniibacteriota TaxID=1752720 RepID=A0A1F6BHB7_9BACT|nr:MAG: hypothetical protein UV09_C0046G0014 [Candidatus Gottesmanbacteria bacterium GW2011_GWA2_42_18]OGG12398.1 MAG: hypothetical protein A2781_03245 [Candidatus Gottesmanbacteria bacterium RIFCSPHIGHO2_01_FULL_42_27]OGG20053.1 MAG: hypothetical protein A3E72_02000 [Candidatus Gottesmanbacteria bacterium RIFCSPHIGHO2_12_FULL_43_26]OGG33758.1 MAG: hypothetical protein A3G68_02795 [Candidatus Gottesmanbacteria bacterium RIFCSPLOWO2_12_FULL_42_10]OGG36172.1 MAG: hypothetical protein A2968_05675 
MIKKRKLFNKEKRISDLEAKLSFYEGRLLDQMSSYNGIVSESVASSIKHQDLIMLFTRVDDLKKEIEELEAD